MSTGALRDFDNWLAAHPTVTDVVRSSPELSDAGINF